MALVVIDPMNNDSFDGANSYVSLDEANEYLADRGVQVTLEVGHVIRGADYVNTFADRFKGVRLPSPSSVMQWPRSGVILEGSFTQVSSTEIPKILKEAQIETAYEISQGRDPSSTISTRVVKRERVDVIEREYDTPPGGQVYAQFDYRRIFLLLAPLLTDDLFRVSR